MQGRGAVVGVLLGATGCWGAGSRGALVGAGTSTQFASEPTRVVVRTTRGIEEIGLDGSGRTALFAGSLTVVDVAADRATYLLSDSETNLFVGDRRTGSRRRVTALDQRLSAAAFSPDGKTIAAVRHSDFSLPQASWKDDDSVFLIDTATLAVDTIAPSSDDWPSIVRWSTDGSALWLIINFNRPAQWISLATRTRHRPGVATHSPGAPWLLEPPPSPVMASVFATPPCAAQLLSGHRATDIRIQDTPSAPPRVLVQLSGRVRGFHDYQDDFLKLALSPGCAYGLFEFERQTWVVDVSTRVFGPLIEGDWLFFEPSRTTP